MYCNVLTHIYLFGIDQDEFQTSIVEDLGKIGVKPDVVTFTSDYFETIRHYAIWMIENGLAYMDDTPQETMQKERMDRINSKHRDDSPAESMKNFKLMCSGKEEGKPWCLRAKIDMSSDNGVSHTHQDYDSLHLLVYKLF